MSSSDSSSAIETTRAEQADVPVPAVLAAAEHRQRRPRVSAQVARAAAGCLPCSAARGRPPSRTRSEPCAASRRAAAWPRPQGSEAGGTRRPPAAPGRAARVRRRRSPSSGRARPRGRRSGRPPTRSRPRAARGSRGAANGASAVEACVIRAGCSIRLSTPPRLSASWKIFVRAQIATASSSDSARNETMPPKSRICRAAIVVAGMRRQAGVEHLLDRRVPVEELRDRLRVLAVLSHPHRRASSARAARASSRTGPARRRATSAGSSRRSATVGSLVATKPPITSEWPPRYFVVEWTTTSAPSASGCCRYGEAKVLSTTTSAPAACAASAAARMSTTFSSGLVGVSSQTMPRPLVEVLGEVRAHLVGREPSRSGSPSARRPARTSGRRRRRRRPPRRRGRPG